MEDGLRIGVDVGGTSVKTAALSRGKILWTRQSGFYSRPALGDLRAALAKVAEPMLDMPEAEHIGLCVPGLRDATGRRVVLATNAPGLVGVDLDALIHEFFGSSTSRICFATDAVAAGWSCVASQRLSGRAIVFSLGTGVGVAVLDDGVPLCVDGDTPGHLGQIDVSVEGFPVIAPDGGAGGLEGYVGVAALKLAYGSDLTSALKNLNGNEPVLQALARAIRICHAIYRPHHVVLCGGIGVRLKPVLNLIDRKVRENLTSVARTNWTLTCADHEFHAALGAASLARENPTSK